METSPSLVEYEGQTPQLFEPVVAERPQRRLSKAESLAFVRTIRARLDRLDGAGGQRGDPEPSDRERLRVA